MQILVIGAGVIGLVVARAAALAGHEVVIAEQSSGIGSGISSRNSEVIHAGMYYPTGSLRAIHCARGRRQLYAYCAQHGVPHRRCGKLIVATNAAEQAQVALIERQGQANGVEGLTMLDGPAARRLEPALSCIGALHSAETGIIDGHAFMLALQGDLEDRGGMIAFATPIEKLQPTARGWAAQYSGQEPGVIEIDAVVNATGLHAQALARATEGYPPACASARMSSGSTASSMTSTRAGPSCSRLAFAAIGRSCRKTRWCRIIPAFAPSSPVPGRRPQISSSTVPPATVCRGSCICSGSN